MSRFEVLRRALSFPLQSVVVALSSPLQKLPFFRPSERIPDRKIVLFFVLITPISVLFLLLEVPDDWSYVRQILSRSSPVGFRVGCLPFTPPERETSPTNVVGFSPSTCPFFVVRDDALSVSSTATVGVLLSREFQWIVRRPLRCWRAHFLAIIH